MTRQGQKLTGAVFVAMLLLGAVPLQGQNFAYVANFSGGSVSVIDTSSYAVVATIPVGTFPNGVTITPDGSEAYVPNQGSNTVSVIATSNNVVIGTIAVGSEPYAVAFSPDGKQAYVSNIGDSTVSVIDTASNTVLTTISGFASPRGIAMNPDGTHVYVVNFGGATVSVIDVATKTIVANINIGGFQAVGVAVTPDGTRAYVTVGQNQSSNGFVAVIDTTNNSVTTTVPVGPAPSLLSITPNGNRVYVADHVFAQSMSMVSVIDTSTNNVVSTISTGTGGVYASAISPDGLRAWVTNVDAGLTSVINVPTNTVITQVAVGAAPQGLAITPFLDSDTGLAKLVGGNTFSGNQAVNGKVTANSFSGDGSSLLNLNPANLALGTAGINITGTAASAISASNAGNALNLGGVAAGNYARLDVANSFTGDQKVTGNLSASGNLTIAGTAALGGGTPIVEHLSATFNPSFPALKPSACAAASFTMTGASDGDTLALGVPNARMTGGGTIIYSSWVSAPNTITIQGCNVSASPQKTAGAGSIRVDVWKH